MILSQFRPPPFHTIRFLRFLLATKSLVAELNVHHATHTSPSLDTILVQFHAIPTFPQTHLNNKISPQVESR